MAIIIWMIVIMIIVAVSQKSKDNQEITQKEYERRMEKKYQNQNNSYHSRQKQEQYKRMNEMHANHEQSLDDVCKYIGYKRCPKCDTFNSKKSEICFMCDYEFKEENNKKTQE